MVNPTDRVIFPTFMVLLTTSDGKSLGYVVQVKNADIAIDACIRSYLVENPEGSIKSQFAYQVSLDNPLKWLEK